MRRESKVTEKLDTYTKKVEESERVLNKAKQMDTPAAVVAELIAVSLHNIAVEKALRWVLGELNDL